MKYRISTFIGDSYSKLKRYKEAIKYYDEAVKLKEEQQSVLNRAICYMDLEEF